MRLLLYFSIALFLIFPVISMAEDKPIVVASMMLLGVGDSSGAAAAVTFHLLTPDGSSAILSPSGADHIDVIH